MPLRMDGATSTNEKVVAGSPISVGKAAKMGGDDTEGGMKTFLPTPPPPKNGDFVDIFCRGTNNLMKQVVLPSFREKVEMKPAGTAGKDLLSKLSAPPEYPGVASMRYAQDPESEHISLC